MRNTQDAKNKLIEQFSQFVNVRPPKGFVSVCNDIDVDVYQYDDEVAGMISSYLQNSLNIDPITIDLGEALDRRLDECERKLHELRSYKNAVSELAKLLTECMEG